MVIAEGQGDGSVELNFVYSPPTHPPLPRPNQMQPQLQTEIMVTPLMDLKRLLNDNPDMKLGLLTLFHERLLQKVLIRDKSLSVKR